MEVQRMLKGTVAFRFAKKNKSILDQDRLAYLNELAVACPVKSVDPKTEIGEIPYGLGKSEKFSNKPQIYAALSALKFIEENYSDIPHRSKSSIKNIRKPLKSPGSVDHHFYKKVLTPFSPGVIRVKSREKSEMRYSDSRAESPAKLHATFLSTPRKYSTPTPMSPSQHKSLVSAQKNIRPIIKTPINTTKIENQDSYVGQEFSSPSKIRSVSSFRKKISVNEAFLTAKSSFYCHFPEPPKPSKSSVHAELKYMQNGGDVIEYNGASINGQKDGYGEILYKNGDWYKGGWKKNLKEGSGKYYYCQYKAKYKGEFREDLPNGPAILSFESGDIFKANWTHGVIDNSLALIQYNDGSEFDGDIKGAKRSGYGKMRYPCNGVYQGTWTNDQRTGHGIILCNGDLFYEGNFSGDYTDGPGVLVRRDIFSQEPIEKRLRTSSAIYQNNGACIEKSDFFNDLNSFPQFRSLPIEVTDIVWMTFTTKNAILYTSKALSPGRFFSGKLNGAGMVKYGLFGIYYGNFTDGKRSGFGKMKYNDPEHQCFWFPETEGEYFGEWKDDKRHGKGTMNWASGTKYEGAFNYDHRHNVIGKITFINGDTYEGGWVEDRMEGSCTLKRRGITIKGQFVAGILNNFARVEYQDNRIYEGDISNSYPHGTGIMKWPNGNTYQGGFTDGVMDGMGRMTYNNGDVYEGKWENGGRNGHGTMLYFSTKHTYEGEWVDGKRSGEGCLKNSKGEVLKMCFWSNDEPMY